jgi:serine/threonine-protein kinase
VYYDYDEPPHGRAFWPWVLAILLVAAAAIAGVYVYRQIQHELNATKPVGVPYVVGLREINAVENIHNVGLSVDQHHIFRTPNDTQPVGFVYKQDPIEGQRTDKGNFVDIWVSTGKPKTTVPDVRGKSRDDAVSALTAAHLDADVHEVSSGQPPNTVIAQDPKPGTTVNQNTKVRINVSSGPRPVGVPNVVGQNYDSAASYLQGQGFAVARVDVQSDQPVDTVIKQDPGPNAFVPPGSKITLTVSKGPKMKAVPNVENSDVDSATSTLQQAGFRVRVIQQDTQDPSLDGIVITQDPASGTEAKPGTTVTLTVGHFVGETTTTPPPP